MSKLTLIGTETVCINYLTALVNNDYSGYDDPSDADQTIDMITTWERSWIDFAGGAITLSYETDEQPADFCRDAISGLWADCTEVMIWAMVEPEPVHRDRSIAGLFKGGHHAFKGAHNA